MSRDLDGALWPAARLGEALPALARHASLDPGAAELPPLAASACDDPAALDAWLDASATGLGLEAEAVETPYPETEAMLRRAGPALLRLRSREGLRYAALLGARGRRLRLLAPDGTLRSVPLEAIRARLCGPLEEGRRPAVDEVLARARVSGARRERAAAALLREGLSAARIGGCTCMRMRPGAPFLKQLAAERLPRLLAGFLAAHLAKLALLMGAWVMVGRAALEGRLDPAWLVSWALVLVTIVPLGLLQELLRGTFSIGLGRLLKARLLAGALALEPEAIRHQGSGQLLGRVVESSAVGSLSLAAALQGAVAVVELVAAGSVLAFGAGGAVHVLLLALWALLTVAMGFRFYRRALEWTTVRLELTHDLVERMVGHRTRLVQEERAAWHEGEDEDLDRYLARSTALDRVSVRLTVWLSRGWLLVGLAGLIPAFVAGGASMVSLAVGLGGVLLAASALGTLTGTISSLTGAAVAWRQARELFHAAARRIASGAPALALSAGGRGAPGEGGQVLETDEVVYRYQDRGEPVLRGCTLRLAEGDRLLIEGPSGGGKSTLVSLLAGLRRPTSGLVLLRGLDRETLGEAGWRRRVAAAPQFQENHVLTGTLAFNLLMGRRWPASARDHAEAEEVCRALGLGELLGRMPSGMLQIVGETGWRLSHGERSRLFIARALLQGAELVLLDESLAALDPESLGQCLGAVVERAKTLVVVAHP